MRIFSSLMDFYRQFCFLTSRFSPHVINPLPLPRSIALSLTVPKTHFKFPKCQLFYADSLSACRPTPILEEQSTVFLTPRGRVAQLKPQVPGTHFNHLLQPAWAKVGLFFSSVTTKETKCVQKCKKKKKTNM